ncbi:LmbE-like protein [Dendrothele bispora CBS 962.96]|uniref:N-acetylglucosaminylphosphatidylinositol deacetylase n=1 Tax=Dendrothele bispora (strain CBS 962.96) TaxID=1314807 RepID=A0A4S8MPK8_DENBC|nr:LmbE-like protein [Dendrothele bispora CBS 962.96]
MTVTATRLAFTVLFFSIFVAVLLRPTQSHYTFNDSSYIHYPEGTNSPDTSRGRILLVTAHPDDECLFFAPTLLGLTLNATSDSSTAQSIEIKEEEIKPEIFALCLSIGDADGLGSVRRDEYERSLDVLGVKSGNRMVLDHPDLRDDIHSRWKPEVIAKVVESFVVEHGITTILTFDRDGISQHPNHKSIPYGVRHLLSNWPTDLESLKMKPRLYTLITVPLSIKYISILAPLLAKYDLYIADVLHHLEDNLIYAFSFIKSLRSRTSVPTDGSEPASTQNVGAARESRNPNPISVFVSGTREYSTALRAMKEHWSQLVWFRWLNVMFSRYMWVNEWIEVKV